VVADPAFAPENGSFSIHTRWIETEFFNDIPAFQSAPAASADEDGERQRVTVEVGGKRLEVVLPAGLGSGPGSAAKSNGKPKRTRGRSGAAAGAAASGDGLASPMQGTIVKVAVAEGDTVAEGDLVVVLEAMKMEQPLTAHKAGTISGLSAKPGDTVSAGAVLATIAD
jgi:acetyl-CoA/propionyl-CoA carboxylase biotin carboxyl carrier protein